MTRPEAWRFVSTLLPPEVAPVAHPQHRAWLRSHAHRHAHQEILFILRGSGHHTLNGEVYPLAPGTVFLFDAFEPHDEFAPAWAPDADHLWLMLMPDYLIARQLTVRNGGQCGAGPCNLLLSPVELGLAAGQSLTALRGEVGLPSALRRLRLLALVSTLIGSVVRAGYTERRGDDRLSFQERIVATVQEHIAATAGNGVTLDSLARISGYSKYHFLRLFKQYTGQSVHEFIDACRLQRVREMEVDGHTKTEIAAALGFSYPSAFSRWYRERQG